MVHGEFKSYDYHRHVAEVCNSLMCAVCHCFFHKEGYVFTHSGVIILSCELFVC